MKKYLLMAAAAIMAFASCEEKLPTEPDAPEVKDAISLTPESGEVGSEGGKAKTMVTSTGKWTLESKMTYDWVTPSVLEGVDGDQVAFEVTANEEEDRTAVFTFTCGKATADYTIKSIAKVLPKAELTLTSPTEHQLGFEAGTFQIKANFTLGYSNITATLSEGADWLTTGTALQGDSDTEALFECSYEKLEGLADRSAEITLKAEGCETVFTIVVKQAAEKQLFVKTKTLGVDLEGGDIKVPVFSNVEYEAVSSEAWLTVKSSTASELVLNAAALTSGKRSATVTLTQKNATGNALTETITVSQSHSIIKWAADMKHARLFPMWPEDRLRDAYPCPATVEALFYVNEFHKPMSVVMGVDGEFLVRFGDDTVPENKMQIVLPGPQKFQDKKYVLDYEFKTHTWYHIACTYNFADGGQQGIVYINGQEVLRFISDLGGLPLMKTFYMNENTGKMEWRAWWYGYGYKADRYFDGLMTEFRMWTKALSPEEINAKDHFYTVDPSTRSLMTYWRFDEGKGDVITDKSTSTVAKHQDLSGQVNVTSEGGTAGINWVPVSLPIE